MNLRFEIPIMPKTLFYLLLLALPALPADAHRQQDRSIVITGAIVYDGSGRAGFRANVRIEGDIITEIGSFRPRSDEEIIPARNLALAPGFIDIHNHSQEGLDRDPTAASQISQGITTLALGPDGYSPWPVGDYLDRRKQRPSAVNVLSFVGHATVRAEVMGKDINREATEEEITKMESLVEQAMREGATGLSSGLEYDEGHSATTEEVIRLARVAARHRGIYMSHIRDEADRVMSAIEEAIRVGREARIPVQISHIKMGTKGVWGKASAAVEMIARARREGLDITADCYPYDAWASTITVLIPSRRHDDPVAVRRGLDDVGGAANVLITNCPARRDYEGKSLEEIARLRSKSPVDIYIEIVRDGGASVVCRSMTRSDIRTFYRQPWVMVSSDGGIGGRHPRGAGTFPRVLGRFVRQWRWLSLAEAIRKMTAMPAERLGLKDRGRIEKGMKADLVLFDPRSIIDRSTFKEPQRLSEGVHRVLVNGKTVWEKGRATGNLSGVVIGRR
jgi:N-acyl-D-amino-acid deacylase